MTFKFILLMFTFIQYMIFKDIGVVILLSAMLVTFALEDIEECIRGRKIKGDKNDI